MQIPLTTVTFPEIRLQTRDAHKLRGYFGNLFREHSPLLHNHFESGEFRYAYPLVQYKVIRGVPTLVGLMEGAKLLIDLFLEIRELDIDGKVYPILSKHIRGEQAEVGVSDELYTYHFATPWMALNQKNYPIYLQCEPTERAQMLKKIAVANILACFKGLNFYVDPSQRIMLLLQTEEKSTQFKNQKMLAFMGSFTTNALLPDLVGLGKSVSRGFGTITIDNNH